MSYEISKICTCEIIDEKNPQRTVFRVIRVGKDGNYKNMDFETTLMLASELNFILERKVTTIYPLPVTDAEFVKGGFQIGGTQSAAKNFANDHAHFRLETAFAIWKFPSALAHGYSYCKDSTIIEKESS